jgi:holin-like protein
MIRKLFRICMQVGLLIGFCLLGDGLVSLMHIQFPGSIIGMFVLFFLLKMRVLRLEWLEDGANFLLGQMLLFFIPPVLGIIQYTHLIGEEGVQLFLVLFCSTLLVMGITGGIAEWIFMRKEAKKQNGST